MIRNNRQITRCPCSSGWCWACVGVYVARALTTVARTHILGRLGQHIVYDLQIELFKHLQLLSLNFYNTLSTGRIMTRVTSDTERMRTFITSGFQDIVINVLTLIGIFLLMLWMNWELTLLAMIPIPFMIIGTLFTARVFTGYTIEFGAASQRSTPCWPIAFPALKW